ncbi:MAG: hypothetical protein HY033_12845 [Ignavibacteriae bacterium]|nr:hypothetical protein [Ignavibacteria bacterium]MBI3365781.1 hypothetical protein [Ignavibacteriota bacterium]
MSTLERDFLERDFVEISNTLVSAYQNWEIWWLYQHERPKYVDILNHYLMFFSNSIGAHFIAMLMSISCLVDDKHLSLKLLYGKVKQEGYLDSDRIQEIENRFNGIEKIIRGVMIIRGNVFAHKSVKIDSDEAFVKANLVHDDLKNLIIELGIIFNIISTGCGRNILGFWENSSKTDTERMLNDLIRFKSKFA